MKLRSDIITHETLVTAAHEVLPHSWLEGYRGFRPRGFTHGHDFLWWTTNETGKRRKPNSGGHGANGVTGYAPTYDEWGWFLAKLYEIDPAMSATYYKNAADFHAQTDGKFRGVPSGRVF